jgi:hypothetical protein
MFFQHVLARSRKPLYGACGHRRLLFHSGFSFGIWQHNILGIFVIPEDRETPVCSPPQIFEKVSRRRPEPVRGIKTGVDLGTPSRLFQTTECIDCYNDYWGGYVSLLFQVL